MSSKNKKAGLLLIIFTPLIVLLLSVSILIAAMIKPYNKLSVYINLAFMDDFKTNPNNGLNGLVIRDNEIKTDYTGNTSEEGEFIRPVYGEQFAVLKSSALGIDVPVYWGSASELFERGACQASYSALPGDKGNTVISAHVDTFFSELTELKTGDKITVNTNYGEFIYTVKETVTFPKTKKTYVVPTEDSRLTLYTCKKDILGSSDERYGVICELTERKFYTEAGEETEN